MAEIPAEAIRIDKLSQVGRYALGVQWGDGHDSILPHRNVRRACPCDDCTAAGADRVAPANGDTPVLVDILGGQSLFIRWGDGHETFLLLAELRTLCRCAQCVPEPNLPISGQ